MIKRTVPRQNTVTSNLKQLIRERKRQRKIKRYGFNAILRRNKDGRYVIVGDKDTPTLSWLKEAPVKEMSGGPEEEHD